MELSCHTQHTQIVAHTACTMVATQPRQPTQTSCRTQLNLRWHFPGSLILLYVVSISFSIPLLHTWFSFVLHRLDTNKWGPTHIFILELLTLKSPKPTSMELLFRQLHCTSPTYILTWIPNILELLGSISNINYWFNSFTLHLHIA